MLLLRTLGEPKLVDAGGRELPALRRKELVLLAYVARRRPRITTRPELATLLWGERPDSNARASLRQALLRLRRTLGPALRLEDESVSLEADALELDLVAFERAVDDGRYADAVAHWAGDFLAGADDAGDAEYRLWLEEEREHSRRRAGWAFEQLVLGATRSGQFADAVRWAREWTRAEPLQEPPNVALVRALLIEGKIAEARVQHAAFRGRHREVLGSDPSPAFLRLASEIDRQASQSEARRQPAGAPADASAIVSAPFVGRAAEFALLSEAWLDLRRGLGSAVIVDGDVGLGKSRLCDELLRSISAQSGDALLLRARTQSAAKEEPWSTLRALLDGIVDAPGLIGVSPATLAELSRVVPELRERFPRLPPPSSDDHALREAVVEVLAAIAAEVPVVLFVDDIDGADRSSLQAVATLASRLTDARVLLLVTSGTELASHRSAWREALVQGSRHRVVALPPLSDREVEILLGSAVPLPLPTCRTLAGRLQRELEGNPRFTLETIGALVAEGYIHRDAGGQWCLSPALGERPLPVGLSMKHAIALRLAALSPGARELAEAIAALPPGADIETLIRATGLSSESLHGAADELTAHQLLQQRGAGAVAPYVIVNEATRFTIAASMPVERRSALQHAAAPEPTSARAAGEAAPQLAPRASRWMRWPVVVPAAIVAVASLAAGARLLPREQAQLEGVVAVGQIRDFAAPDGELAGALADMLSTNLARVPGLHVISHARVLEIEREVARSDRIPPDSLDERRGIWRVSRAAGVDDIVEGELYRESADELRLDVRRVDARTGIVREGASVRGASVFQVVDLATARLAPGSVSGADTLRIADVSTGSLTAYRLYEDGLRAYYRDGDAITAKRLFAAALREDSTFAMASYYRATLFGGGPGEGWTEFERADRLAAHASERERLLIRGAWALERNDPVVASYAESLSTRYPDEPDALLLAAHAQSYEGRFLDAVATATRVLSMDSLSFRPPRDSVSAGRAPGRSWRCLACDALYQITLNYQLADSTAAAIRTGEYGVRRQPDHPDAQRALAWTLLWSERYREALEAYQRSQPPSVQSTPGNEDFYVNLALRTGDYHEADEVLQALIRSEDRNLRIYGLDWYVTSLRYQGRPAAALVVAKEARAMDLTLDSTGILAFDGTIYVALALLEAGRARAAAALFDTIANRSAPVEPVLRSRAARHRAWMLTHAADALAAAGDTTPLARLADSVQRLGARSFSGRDQRLHHHVRGLLYRARGQLEAAAREFRQAIQSPTLGYTRTNLELGRTLLALGRPREAVEIVRPALHGSLDASNLYVTRTELQEAMALAFDAARERDSARTYYERVASAWRDAEPPFRARQQYAARRVLALQRSLARPKS